MGGGGTFPDAALREAATEAVGEVQPTVATVFSLLRTRFRNASFSRRSAYISL